MSISAFGSRVSGFGDAGSDLDVSVEVCSHVNYDIAKNWLGHMAAMARKATDPQAAL